MLIRDGLVMNSKGVPVELNPLELFRANALTMRIENELGYDIPVTVLTSIMKLITEQKFFEIAPADYLPVRVGEGSWSQVLTTYRSFDLAGSFEDGIVNTGVNNARLAAADAGVDALNIAVFNWAKSIGWTIMDLMQAAKAGNWDLVTAKEKARKRNWDLGIQRIAFLGAQGQNSSSGNCLGLLNQGGVTVNTTLITKAISTMTTGELKTFSAGLINAYRSNCQRSAWPNRFVIPESDYLGLASQASADFPIKSTLELLEEAFKLNTRNADFKIMPLAYGDAAYHADVTSIAGKQVYALYNSEEESLRMDIPVDYTNTLANSIDNFSFQNTGYGQFTGVLAYRPLELMYFTYTA